MERIRQLPADSGGAVPAIALTAYARTEDRMRAFRSGYQAHLAKPVEPTELVATIASLAELIEAQRRSQ
jgi:CheY-like chemotaxis protein